MSPLVRKTWPVLALIAGALLIYFECRRGVSGEGVFWLIVGGLIVVLAAAEFIPKKTADTPETQRPDDRLPLE